MKMECKIGLRLNAELTDAGTMKITAFLNEAQSLVWFIPLDKFHSEKVISIQEDL